MVLAHACPRPGFDPQLLAFSVPDNHIHLLFGCDRRVAGVFVNHLLGGLVTGLGLEGGFGGAWFGGVETWRHLHSTLHYVLRQHQRHETRNDPLREASSLPDLLGLRPVGEFTHRNVLRLFPRLRTETFVPYLGVQDLREGSHPGWLGDSAAASVAADSPIGKSADVVRARVAAAHWGRTRGLSTSWLGEHLGVSPRSIRRSLALEANPALVQAIGLQVGLREAAQKQRLASA
jgi:hypothetical protein